MPLSTEHRVRLEVLHKVARSYGDRQQMGIDIITPILREEKWRKIGFLIAKILGVKKLWNR